MSDSSVKTSKSVGTFAKVMVILGGISGFLALLVAIKASLLQLFPAAVVNATNAQLAMLSEAVFGTDCDLTGNGKCEKGCAGQTTIEKAGGGYRFYNERKQPAAVISLGPRELFAPRWADALGGLFVSASADCKKLEFDNGSAWSFVSSRRK